MSSITDRPDVPEISWFSALCDDDYEFLGVPDPTLASSWEHCSDIVRTADRNGFDNVLLPSGYTLGIDSTAFAAAIATHTEQINLLLAVRMGEMWLPQLARQLASIDQFANGRLCINIISSDIPGEELESSPRYQRTREWMQVLRQLLDGQSIDFHGEFVDLTLDPPRASTVSGTCPPMYFGGFSPAAKDVAAAEADVFLTWPDTVGNVAATVDEMTALASERYDRSLVYGLRAHMIVRETEAEARALPRSGSCPVSTPTPATRSATSRSTPRPSESNARHRCGRRPRTTVSSRRPSGPASDEHEAAPARRSSAIPTRCSRSSGRIRRPASAAFILSGYTHIAECDLVAEHVLPRLDHAALKPRWAP